MYRDYQYYCNFSPRAARLIFVVTFTLFDVSYAVYNHYSGIKTNTG